MGVKTVAHPSAEERMLLRIARELPPERLAQVLDYARYVQTQTADDFSLLEEDATEEERRADDERWDALLASDPQALDRWMAEVRADIESGNTTPIIIDIENETLSPQ